VHVIAPDGKYSEIVLGCDLDDGQVPQAVVKAGCWFGSHVADWKSWALVGCTVAPGFDFDDFKMASREVLTRQYPQHGKLIGQLTREWALRHEMSSPPARPVGSVRAGAHEGL